MIQRQLKLRLTSKQESQLTDWLWHLTGVWNWAIRKLELDARDRVYYTPKAFHNVPSKLSTKTCSACGSLSGPTGYTGLSVRQWMCAVCGTAHDRDVNAAVNTLHAGVGTTHEGRRKAASGISWL